MVDHAVRIVGRRVNEVHKDVVQVHADVNAGEQTERWIDGGVVHIWCRPSSTPGRRRLTVRTGFEHRCQRTRVDGAATVEADKWIDFHHKGLQLQIPRSRLSTY